MSCHPHTPPNQTPLFKQGPGRLNISLAYGDAACERLDFDIDTTGYEVVVEVYSLGTNRVVQSIVPTPVNESEGVYSLVWGYGAAAPLPAGLYGVRAKWVTPGAPGYPRTVLDGFLEVKA
jgi:hypothetical protein